MFFEALIGLMGLLDEAWLLLSHVSSRGSFPRALSPGEERETAERMRAGDDDILNEILQTTRKLCSQPAIADNRFAKNALAACEMWERHLGYR